MKAGERGSALILMPAAVLILLVLAAITVDFSIAFLGQRELANVAAGAANDAAAIALDDARLRSDDVLVLDEAAARLAVQRALGSRSAGSVRIDTTDVRVEGRRVTVHVEGFVAYIFSPALPGGPKRARVQATATAELRTR